MRYSSLLLVFALAFSQAPCISATTLPADYEFAPMYESIPFEMPPVHRPVIPGYEVSITDFGGNGDGHTKNTGAFAAAMKHLSEKEVESSLCRQEYGTPVLSCLRTMSSFILTAGH